MDVSNTIYSFRCNHILTNLLYKTWPGVFVLLVSPKLTGLSTVTADLTISCLYPEGRSTSLTYPEMDVDLILVTHDLGFTATSLCGRRKGEHSYFTLLFPTFSYIPHFLPEKYPLPACRSIKHKEYIGIAHFIVQFFIDIKVLLYVIVEEESMCSIVVTI